MLLNDQSIEYYSSRVIVCLLEINLRSVAELLGIQV
jgi:hypothetical protein